MNVRFQPSTGTGLATQGSNTPESIQKTLPPTRLKIESIGVDTSIKPAGLTSEGDMAIDDNIDTVAWYQLGTVSGDQGSSVIAGHYGWRDGRASVFNELHTLKVGDNIVTSNQDNVETRFIVKEIRTYNPNADATEVFRSTDGKAHLNLITCIGTWNTLQQSYSERLVVFTDMVSN